MNTLAQLRKLSIYKPMQESKFNLYGEHIRPNGHQQWDILSYIAETREEAIATCSDCLLSCLGNVTQNVPLLMSIGADMFAVEIELRFLHWFVDRKFTKLSESVHSSFNILSRCCPRKMIV